MAVIPDGISTDSNISIPAKHPSGISVNNGANVTDFNDEVHRKAYSSSPVIYDGSVIEVYLSCSMKHSSPNE